MPGIVGVLVALLGHAGRAVDLMPEARCVIAAGDGLGDFFQAIGQGLAGFERDDVGEVGRVPAQMLADKPDEFETLAEAGLAPVGEGLDRARHRRIGELAIALAELGETRAVDRGADEQRAVAIGFTLDAYAVECLPGIEG